MSAFYRQGLPRGSSIYLPYSIRVAGEAVQLYKTRDPFEIMEQKKIKLWWSFRFQELLGFYVIRNRTQYIGINANVDEKTQRVAASHELGHAFIHKNEAAHGAKFHNTMLYSVSASRKERDANLFAAELLIPDDNILEPCCYEAYVELQDQLHENAESSHSDEYKQYMEEELLQDFYDGHQSMATMEDLAYENSVDIHLVEFKFLALKQKGYEMPYVEVDSGFLKGMGRRRQ